MIDLGKSVEMAPDNACCSYVHALALQSTGKVEESIQVLKYLCRHVSSK